jgi:prevent-host-death family protein
MKFITSREIRSNPARLWEGSRETESIITVNGKPRAVVITAEEDLETTLLAVRKARAALALEKIRIESRKTGTDRLTKADIDKEIRQVRKMQVHRS